MRLLVLANKKNKKSNFILIIIDCLIQIVYYKPVKVIINISSLAKIIINMIIYYHGIFNSIIIN